MGAFLDGEWESICKLFTVEESPDLSCNFLEYSSPVSEQDDNLTFPVVPQINENSHSSFDGWISDPPHRFLQTKTSHTNNTDNSADNLFSGDILSCIDFSMVSSENDGSLGLPFVFDKRSGTMHENEPSNTPHFNNLLHSNNNNNTSVNMLSPNTELTLKRKRDAPVPQDSEEEMMSLMMEPPKKNACASKDARKKKRKATQTSEDEITPIANTKESKETADSNSDDSNPCVSEEINETEDSTSNVTVSLTSTGKKRASRGAATDPQSLYARKRRMRINERLKILQQLVPNGTKVDISTMLEEAFHYVKFLQLQIRLLSSDEMWMYAPLAYNGLDVGAYRRMPPFQGL